MLSSTTSARRSALMLITLMAIPSLQAKEKDTSTTEEVTWTRTVAGEAAGSETLKTVLSGSGTYFASGSRLSSEKKPKRTLTHLQRDPDQQLRKYKRTRDVRKGKGLFAFRKNELIRVVGVNNKKQAAVELANATLAAVWDDRVWHPLDAWFRFMDLQADSQEITVLDLGQLQLRKATIQRRGTHTFSHANGEAVDADRWQISGLSTEPLLAFIGDSGALLAVEQGSAAMLREGWKWEGPKTSTDTLVDEAESSPEATKEPPEATKEPPEATKEPPETTKEPPETTKEPPETTKEPPETTDQGETPEEVQPPDTSAEPDGETPVKEDAQEMP